MTRLMKWLMLCTLLAASVPARANVTPKNVEQFFAWPTPVTLKFTSDDPATKSLHYIVTDFAGKGTNAGDAAVGEGGTVEINLDVSRGFYTISFPDSKQQFGMIVLPERTGTPDPFFCIDAGLSWLVKSDADRDALVTILRRSGVAMARERLHWGAIEPKVEAWNWEGDRKYASLRELYELAGVPILDVFHDAPAWTGATKENPFPADVIAAANAWTLIGQKWQANWGGLEVWNEPDHEPFGAGLPADQYVPLVKAISYANRFHGVKAPLGGGVFAFNRPQYLRACAQNGMLDCVDFVSFHTYDRAPNVSLSIEAMREWLNEAGQPAIPLWITESGRSWKMGTDRPTPEEDAQSALDITMKAIETKACGVARYFPFVYPYFEESGQNFGMMGKELTPLRSMAAYENAIVTLSHKPYIGDLKIDDASLLRARVFEDGQEAIVVLYTGKIDTEKSVKLPLPILRAQGIDGRELKPAESSIGIPDGLTYAWVDRKAIETHLFEDTPAMRLNAMVKIAKPAARKAGKPSPIVLQHRIDPRQQTVTVRGYSLTPEQAKKWTFNVRASNLSDEPQSFQLSLDPQEGVLLTALALAVPDELAGAATRDQTFELDLSKALEDGKHVTLTVRATGEMLPPTTPLAIDVFMPPDAAAMMERLKDQPAMNVADLERWTPSIVSDGKMSMKVTPDKAWRLEATFAQGDPWVYPIYTRPEALTFSRARGLILNARCEKNATVRIMLIEKNDARYLTPDSIIPADGQWHASFIPFDELMPLTIGAPDDNGKLDLDAVNRISIGMNSPSKENALEVKDLRLVPAE